MANRWELWLPATAFVPDASAQLVAGDAACGFSAHRGRSALAFDTSVLEAAVSHEFAWPSNASTGTVKADIHYYSETANTSNFRFEVFVEAKNPGTDTLDLETAVSWGSANAQSAALGGTAGDPRKVTVTLTNKDSVAAGYTTRIGIRRANDHADDAASGDAFVLGLLIYEEE